MEKAHYVASAARLWLLQQYDREREAFGNLCALHLRRKSCIIALGGQPNKGAMVRTLNEGEL